MHFLYIGKTGGSAMKVALEPFLINERYVINLYGHSITLRGVPKGEGVIFFLRDPITRFTSGFSSRKRKGQPRYNYPWNKNEKMAFEYFETPNDLGIALSSQDEEEKARAEKAMKSIGHVNSSYWDWFESEEYYLSRLADIFFVGFQESLTEDWEKFKFKLGLPDSAKLPENDIEAHRNPQYFARSLQDEAVENLKNWYQDDYKFIKLVNMYRN